MESKAFGFRHFSICGWRSKPSNTGMTFVREAAMLLRHPPDLLEIVLSEPTSGCLRLLQATCESSQSLKWEYQSAFDDYLFLG